MRADGSLVLLDDGSVWVVASRKRERNVKWREGSAVDVEPGPHGEYRLVEPVFGIVGARRIRRRKVATP